MEVVKLVYHEHMLGGNTKVTHHTVSGQTAWDFLVAEGMFAQDVRVFLNHEPVGADDLKKHVLGDRDALNVVNVQKAEAAVAWLVSVGFSTVAATILFNIAVSLAISFVISTVFGPEDRGFVEQRKDPDGYGITGGANQARQFAPVPLVMGTHRIYPDYASPWVADYIKDEDVFRDICNSTPTYGDVALPDFAFTPTPPTKNWTSFSPAEQLPSGWTAASTNPTWGTVEPYVFFIEVDGVSNCQIDSPFGVAVQWTPPDPDDPFNQEWTDGSLKWTSYADYFASVEDCQETFDGTICPSAKWKDYVSGQVVNMIVAYGYTAFETTQRLTNVFSYGFGDMALSDHRIGTTVADSFENVEIHLPVFSSTGTSLLNWHHGPDITATPTIEYPANCESVDGGELRQYSGVLSDGWVTRESSRKTSTYLEVDFAGRLFSNGPGGAGTLNRDFDCQYRLVGSAAWTPAPGFPVTFSNGDTTPYRETRGWSVPSGRYEVRVRKVSADETDAQNVCDVNFERFKSYVDDPITTYPAINRIGVQIQASGQLNGSLDRWSSLASVKCWVYTASTYDGTEPGASGNWSWTETSNPAWWFLYFTMGGFLNTSDPKGWKVGVHSTNGERLFGAGLPNAMIDFASIHQFSKWCTAKNLSFGAVVDAQRPCQDVMIDIAAAGRGSPCRNGAKVGVAWADPADIPVGQFGMGNIIAGSFEIGYNIERKIDEYVATYNDASDFYNSRQVRAVVPGVINPVNSSTLQFFGVTSEEQAQREVNLRAADIRYHIRRIVFETSIEGMVPQRGDVVMLAHDLTAWAYSGRLQDISADLKTVALPRELHDPAAAGDYWVQLRLPDGTFVKQKIAAPVTPITTVVFDTPLPDFPDHFPEDYLFQAGPSDTPGKRCRVLAIEPSQEATVKITCTDDYPEYYLQESATTNDPTERDERLVARVYNSVVEVRGDGNWLCWEIENCRGAQVSAVVDGGSGSTIAGNLVVPGTELKLPTYAAGTVLTLTLIPDDVVSAVASVSDTTTFTF